MYNRNSGEVSAFLPIALRVS